MPTNPGIKKIKTRKSKQAERRFFFIQLFNKINKHIKIWFVFNKFFILKSSKKIIDMGYPEHCRKIV